MLMAELILRVHRKDMKKHQSHLFFSSLGKHEKTFTFRNSLHAWRCPAGHQRLGQPTKSVLETCGFIQSLPLWMPHRTACEGISMLWAESSAASRKNAVPILWDLSIWLSTYVPKSWSHNLCQPGGASSHATCIMKCLSHHALYMESSFQPVGLCTCSLHCLQYSLLAFALASTLSFFRAQMSPPWRSLPWPSHFSWHALILYLTCSHCLYGCYHNLERSCQYTVFV